jgi:AraC family transcriptional regulator, glycine betaine-responsive activator
MALSAICFGVTGTWEDLPAVSPAPVTAQVMKTSRFMASGMAFLLVDMCIRRENFAACFT